MPETIATFSEEAAGQVYNQTNEFVFLGGNGNQNADLSIEVKWIVAEKTKAGLRHVVVCPNVTGRTKKRIAQSNRKNKEEDSPKQPEEQRRG